MVRALLDGTKTQTRRACKPMNAWVDQECREVRMVDGAPYHFLKGATDPVEKLRWPYGQPGDRLWVRETWAQPAALDPGPTVYRADYPDCVPRGYTNIPPADEITWKPSIHMFRKHSRILLEVVSVRVERLQDISEADAIAEGIEPNWCGDLKKGPNGFGGQGWVPDCGWINYLSGPDGDEACTARESYQTLWESINGAGSWDANPWVWVVAVKRVAP